MIEIQQGTSECRDNSPTDKGAESNKVEFNEYKSQSEAQERAAALQTQKGMKRQNHEI